MKRHRAQRGEDGRALVVRNGRCRPRHVTTGPGTVEVQAPRVHDRRSGHRFTSSILPRYMRRSPKVSEVLPVLYLPGALDGRLQGSSRCFAGGQGLGPVGFQHHPDDVGLGKTAVAGVKDRKTKQVRTQVVRRTDKKTLQGFIRESVKPGATVYTDEYPSYRNLQGFEHDSVGHSAGEYLKDVDVHTNGIERLLSMFKRGYVGIYHKMSPKHLDRYVAEFQHWQNQREDDTVDQMEALVRQMGPKRLRYADLIKPNGQPSGARAA